MGDILPGWDVAFIKSCFGNYSVDVTIKCNARKGWKNVHGQRIGFALVIFPSAASAETVLREFSGKMIPGTESTFNLKPNVWSNPTNPASHSPDEDKVSQISSAVDCDPETPLEPPLELQLEPCTISQLRERLALFGCDTKCAEEDAQRRGGRLEKKKVLVETLCKLHRQQPPKIERRRRIFAAGTPVPDELIVPLLDQLRQTNFPPKRRNVTAQEYLVLGMPGAGAPARHLDKFQRLWDLARGMITCMAPGFQYTSIAVTKNFVGSPHVDMGDKTFQYAVSMGDFRSGGELCVEASPFEVFVVDTKNKIAKVDGRFPHWVRRFEGERFSLIFYRVDGDTSPKEQAVYL